MTGRIEMRGKTPLIKSPSPRVPVPVSCSIQLCTSPTSGKAHELLNKSLEDNKAGGWAWGSPLLHGGCLYSGCDLHASTLRHQQVQILHEEGFSNGLEYFIFKQSIVQWQSGVCSCYLPSVPHGVMHFKHVLSTPCWMQLYVIILVPCFAKENRSLLGKYLCF